MKEIKGNVFDLALEDGVDSICITTNGITNFNGLAIMGAGTAGEAARRWPAVRVNLGKALKAFGNFPYVIGMINKQGDFVNPSSKAIKEKDYKCLIWSFPTKNDFRYNSIPALIERSALALVEHVNKFDLKKIMIPRPGCSNGGLQFDEVKKIIEPIFDDRFHITTLEGEV